jgi:hypothetical protein
MKGKLEKLLRWRGIIARLSLWVLPALAADVAAKPVTLTVPNGLPRDSRTEPCASWPSSSAR